MMIVSSAATEAAAADEEIAEAAKELAEAVSNIRTVATPRIAYDAPRANAPPRLFMASSPVADWPEILTPSNYPLGAKGDVDLDQALPVFKRQTIELTEVRRRQSTV